MKEEIPFFIGSYYKTGPYVPRANGEGVLSCSLNLNTGKIRRLQVSKEKVNATYLKRHEKHLFVACDNFEATGEVRAYVIEEDASLDLLSTRSTFGTSSCHVEYDPQKQLIFISSYANGRLSAHHFEAGNITPEPQLLTYEGSGPNPDRQEAPHIHQAILSPNGKWLYACDLGSDKIWLHEVSDGVVTVIAGIPTPAGSGPRHLVCHPQLSLVYVFCELDARLLTYKVYEDSGLLELLYSSETLPRDFQGPPAGAAIRLHPGHKSLFVSNRNHHSLTAFSLNDGKPEYRSNFSIQGKEPRDFNIDPTGNWLLVANQNSDSVVPFKLDPDSSLPTMEQGPEFYCGTPVCIEF